MSAHTETVKKWTELYNDREGVTIKGKDQLLEYGKGWVAGFSDVRYANQQYVETGDGVFFRCTADGTNDGAYGPAAATGKSVSVPVTNYIEFGPNGEVTRVEQLYDRLSILSQLGLAEG